VKVYTEPAAPVAKQAVQVRVTAAEGAALEAEWALRDRPDVRMTVHSAAALVRAQNRGLTLESLKEQFGRLGGTPYELAGVEFVSAGLVFAPASVLNQMRREAVEALQRRQSEASKVTIHDPQSALAEVRMPEAGAADAGARCLHLLVRTAEQLEAALALRPSSITLDYLDLYGLRPSVEHGKLSGVEIRVAAPRVLKPGEARIVNFLLSLDCPLLVRSTGMLQALRGQSHAALTGDFSLNTANTLTAAAMLELGLQRLTPTHDLNAEQVTHLARSIGAGKLEAVAYQHLPVFHTEHCVFCRFLSKGTTYKDCGRPCEEHRVALKDPSGRAHPVMADVGCRNTVFGAEAQESSLHMGRWLADGIRHFRLEFVHESGEEVRQVTRAFQAMLDGRVTGEQLAAELKRVAPQGTTQGSLFVPEGYLTLPILQ
jgi:putative protease